MTNVSFPGVALPLLHPCRSNGSGGGQTNGTRAASSRQAEDTDFGAVLYIVVVLTFYSFGIVVMIVKYLKTEKKEMEEEMALESFFKGIPNQRLENEREAVNRVAIQAFHTLTAARGNNKQELDTAGRAARTDHRSAVKGLSRSFCPPQGYSHAHHVPHASLPAHHGRVTLNPSHYRRERFSIQPKNIGTAAATLHRVDDDGYHDDDDTSHACGGRRDCSDNSFELKPLTNPNRPAGTSDMSFYGACIGQSRIDEDLCEENTDQDSFQVVPHLPAKHLNGDADTKTLRTPKSVMFSDTVIPTGKPAKLYTPRDGSANARREPTHQVSDRSANVSSDHRGKQREKETPIFHLPPVSVEDTFSVSSSDGEFFTPSVEKPVSEPSAEDEAACSPISEHDTTTHNGRNQPGGTHGAKYIPDLGPTPDPARLPHARKGSGDASSSYSSSSLPSRIHLSEPTTSPMRSRTASYARDNDAIPSTTHPSTALPPRPTMTQPSSNSGRGGCTSTSPLAKDCQPQTCRRPSDCGVPSMQQTHDPTPPSAGGLVTAVMTPETGDDNGSKKSCLVTDL